MARAGVSGRKLAAMLGVTHQSLARRISGELAFDVERLAQIATALDVPIDRLYAVTAQPSATAAAVAS